METSATFFDQVHSPSQTVDITMDDMRSQSDTSSSSIKGGARPKSRASTTSNHSQTTQLNHDQATPKDTYGFNPLSHEQQPFRTDPEEMIRQSAHQLKNPNQGFYLDPSLRDSTHEDLAYPMDQNYAIQQLSHGLPGIQYPVYDADSHLQEVLTEDHASDGVGSKRKKGSATTIANDIELRRLYREYEGKSLEDMAKEVLTHERGSKSEKSKQIFAMLWLSKMCKKSGGSVPRSRVFSHYASRCGNERVPPLNPASFGKLVRIIFPGVQTRRLGVRGESKYHYVDLSLEDDQVHGSAARPSLSGDASNMSVNTSHLPTDTAVFPSPGGSFGPGLNFADPPQPTSTIDARSSKGIHVDQNVIGPYLDASTVNVLSRTIGFPDPRDSPQVEDRGIQLPDIWSYVPTNTDPDLADALTALYRAHCISVIDNFRYCKEKMFFHHFTAFHGTLTVPVQKLLADPKLAPWVKECDWLMYQKMVAFVGPLTTQVVPNAVLDVMKSISLRLVGHIESTFRHQPRHVALAKLIPASIFSSLLKRLLRVNASAHAAANILTNPANRQQMWDDWVRFVDPELVVESSVPVSGFSTTKKILMYDVRKLLQPLENTSHLEYGSLESLGTFDSSMGSTAFPDRWVQLLSSLPNQFRCMADEPDRLVSYHSDVWQAALRDLTIAGAQSFGSWWVANVFMCEMLQWIVESSGFMQRPAVSGSGLEEEVVFMRNHDISLAEGGSLLGGRSDSGSGFTSERPRTGHTERSQNSGSNESNSIPSQHAQHHGYHVLQASTSTQQRLSDLNTSIGKKLQESEHDDSGIGMGMEDDDIALNMVGIGKYDGEMAMLKSDPADAEGEVVVCR